MKNGIFLGASRAGVVFGLILTYQFLTPPALHGESREHLLRASDYDGDGRSDVALFDPVTGTYLIRKSSTGKDHRIKLRTSGTLPAPGDFDRDGIADAAAFNPTTAEWFIHHSSGTKQTVKFGSLGTIPVPGDYGGNSCSDLATFATKNARWRISDCASGSVRSLKLGGTGALPVPFDYDGDGRLDPAVFAPITGEWVILRSSDGQKKKFAFGSAGDIPLAYDATGDGLGDAILYRPGTSQFFLRKRDGKVKSPLQFGLPGDAPLLLDTLGNGRAEYSVRRHQIGTFFVYHDERSMTGTNLSFNRIQNSSSQPQTPSPVVDAPCGIPELAGFQIPFLTEDLCEDLRELYNSYGNELPPPDDDLQGVGIPVGSAAALVLARRVEGDYNGDGKSDLVLVKQSRGAYRWTIMLEKDTFAHYHFGLPSDMLAPGDYLGYGMTQPAVVRKAGTGGLEWYVRRRDGSVIFDTFGLHSDQPLAGDLDCDGKADKVVVRNTGEGLTWYVRQSTGGDVSFPFGLSGDRLYIADMNGDTCGDLVVSRNVGGAIHWFYSAPLTDEVSSLAWGLQGDHLLQPTDVDGDGRAELIVSRTTGNHLSTYIQLRDGSVMTIPTGVPGDVLLIGQFSGVNRAEFAVYHPSESETGQLIINRFNGISETIPLDALVEAVIRPDGSVALPGTTVSEDNGLQCHKVTDFRDGARRGALWKPVSENTGRVVVLLPSSYVTVQKLEVFGTQAGTVVKVAEGRNRGYLANGNRAHFDLNKSASQLSSYKPLTVRLTLRTGFKECRTVPDPRQRQD